MSEAQRPIEALHAWFQEQHHEVKERIAEMMAIMAADVLVPPIERKRTGADTIDVWVAQIAEALQKGVKTMTPFAFVLFMRSMISFSFIGTMPDAERERFLPSACRGNGVRGAYRTLGSAAGGDAVPRTAVVASGGDVGDSLSGGAVG